jgi:hypothetical protein
MMRTRTRPGAVCAFDYAFVVLLVESEASLCGGAWCVKDQTHLVVHLRESSASTCFNGNRLLGKFAQVGSCIPLTRTPDKQLFVANAGL